MDTGIKVDLEYYDEVHRDLLRKYSSFEAIDDLVRNGCVIPSAEFFTYYLFYKKRPNLSGYDSYESISRKVELAAMEMDGFVSFNNHSMSATLGSVPFNNAIAERIGEGIGLSVVNKIHGLTAADWGKIPEHNKAKTLDYELASDGYSVIQVEAKGNCSNDNCLKSSSISKHKKSIEEKKGQNLSGASQSVIMYGTIASIDRRSSPIRCWILDPEPPLYDRVPQQVKLLNRLMYLSTWISYVSPRSNLAVALLNRVQLAEIASDPFEFDNIPILNRYHEPFSQYSIGGKYRIRTFFLGKSYTLEHDCVGIVRFSGVNCFTFVGIAEVLAKQAVYQKYDELLKFQNEARASTVEVLCSVPRWHWNELRDDLKRKIRSIESKNDIQFKLPFYTYQSKSGIAIGFCDVRTL